MRKAVFLDRDGVINPLVYHPEFGIVDSPARPEDFELKPGVGQAVRMIADLDYLAIVISNQPGVAKGKMTMALLDETKAKMVRELQKENAHLDGIYYCLHHPDARLPEYRMRCECRKPRPGLLQQAALEWDIDLSASFFVGDGITDILAGQAAGCMTILVNSRKCYLCDELSRQGVEPDYMAKDLPDALTAITAYEYQDKSALAPYKFRCRLKSAGKDEAE